MVHYANIIRKMGPLIYMSMFRFDGKHTDLKKFVRNTNNFININKTLASKHQQNLAANENSFCDKFAHSKQKGVKIDFVEQNYGSHISFQIQNCTNLFEVNSFSCNAYNYKRGSVISFEKKLFEIEMILLIDTQFFFVVKMLKFLGIHEFSRSLKVETPESLQFCLIKYSDILYKKPHCCKFVNEAQYVIIDNRDILKTLSSN